MAFFVPDMWVNLKLKHIMFSIIVRWHLFVMLASGFETIPSRALQSEKTLTTGAP